MNRLIEFLPFPAILCRYSDASEINDEALKWENCNAHWRHLRVETEELAPAFLRNLREAVQGKRDVFEFSVALRSDETPSETPQLRRVWFRVSRIAPENSGVAFSPGERETQTVWLISGVDCGELLAEEEREWAQRIEQLDLQHERDEVALRLARRHLQAFFDDSASGKALVSLDGEILSANAALRRRLGGDSHESDTANERANEAKWLEWVPASRETLHSALRVLRENGAPISGLEVEAKPCGAKACGANLNGANPSVFFLLSLSLVRDSRGRALYVAAEFSDVTASILAQRELDKINGELARSNAELERFAFVASHDLQEPLRKICVFGERLENELKKAGVEGNAQVYLGRIVAGAHRMTNLISAVLEYSRLSQTASRAEAVDLNVLLAEIAREFGDDLTISLEKLPVVHGNRGRLTRLFENLLSNARKFRAHCEPRATIRWTQTQRDADGKEWAILCVRDNGIGFEPSSAEKIFEVFARLHSREAYAGTGIGLAICRRIARENGGDVWAQSNAQVPDLRPDESSSGATFWLRLPIQRVEKGNEHHKAKAISVNGLVSPLEN